MGRLENLIGQDLDLDTHSSSINGINGSLLQKLFTAVVLAIAFFISAGMVVYLSLRSKEVKVPNVIGKSQADAEKLLVAEGLRLKEKATGVDKKTEASLIGGQTPSAGSTVKAGQVVTVTFGTDAEDKKEEVANAKPTPKPTAKPSASPTAKPKPKPSGSPSPSPADASKGKDANKGDNKTSSDSKNTNETAKGKPSPSPTVKGKPSPSPTPKGKPSPSPTAKASPKPSPKKPGTN